MMTTRSNFPVRVIADYQAPYADPIRVNAGDEVMVNSDKYTDIPGWVWCTDRDGKSGWVPKTYLEYSGKAGKMLCDYNAIELTVHVGEILAVHKAESDFYWVTNQKELQGWVPIAHVEACENQSEVR
ncbi:MAG: SH3 domain-containing protein [Anaerolineales bacterium]|nr:SH3 domain-containing protein [Anaerolineales bacterium]